MYNKNYVTCVYGEKSVVQTSYIELENREIPHKHYIDENGNIDIVVNGTKPNELLEKPLFRNTFSVINGKVNNPEKIQS